jgi:hypothetical protein
MSREYSEVICGVELVQRRNKLVACFGFDYFVHFQQMTDDAKWVARRPNALEWLATEDTLEAAVTKALAHYNALEADLNRRMQRRIREAEDLLPCPNPNSCGRHGECSRRGEGVCRRDRALSSSSSAPLEK